VRVTELAEGRTGVQAASLPTREVLDALQTSEQEGLSSAEAELRLEEFGPNVLQKSSGDGVLKLLWRQINDPLIYVLLASAALAVALGALVDGLVVLGVVVINTLIGFAQEYKAGKDIEALTGLVPDETTVLRDGNRTSVAAPKIVPGDVVLLEPGDKVAADARLLAERNLQVDESALTGESVPVYKGADPVPEGSPVAERSDMVHGGTLVTSGTGRAVVTATAGDRELGRISEMLGGTTEVETPLTRQITVLGKWITIVISAVAVLLFLVGFLRGYTAVDAVLAAIALAVAAVPEGLPAVITIALAVGVQRMARRRAVIRYLPAAETLGSATVICTDKTGTLTKNEMTVKELWTPVGPGDGTAYELSGVGYAPDRGLSTFDGENLGAIPEGLHELLLAAAEALKRHRAAQNAERLRLGSLWEDNGLVFPGERGQPMRSYSLTGGSFKRLLERAGLPAGTRFHDLRHTCATLLFMDGLHPKLVQELLGHATISITLDTYSHVLPGMDDGLAGAMGDALGAEAPRWCNGWCRRLPTFSREPSLLPLFAGTSVVGAVGLEPTL